MPIRPISTSLPTTQFEDPVSPVSEGMLNATATLGALGPKLAQIRLEREGRQDANNRFAASEGVDPGTGGIWSNIARTVSARNQVAAGDKRTMMDLERRKAEASIAAHKAAQARYESQGAGLWQGLDGPGKQGTPRATGIQKTDTGYFRENEKGQTERWDVHGNPLTSGSQPLPGKGPGGAPAPVESTSGYEDPHPGIRHLWGAIPGMTGVPGEAEFNASQDAPPHQFPPGVAGQPPAAARGIFSVAPAQSGGQPPIAPVAPPGAAPAAPQDMAARVNALHPDDQAKYQAIMKSGKKDLIDQANKLLMQAPAGQ